MKESLRKSLDGGGLAGIKTSAKSWAKALGNIKTKTGAIANFTPDIPGSLTLAEDLITRITSNELANAVSDSVTEWMADTIAPIIAEELASIVAAEMTTYIKTATIIVPPGQVVAVAGSPSAQTGATTAPSPPAQIT